MRTRPRPGHATHRRGPAGDAAWHGTSSTVTDADGCGFDRCRPVPARHTSARRAPFPAPCRFAVIMMITRRAGSYSAKAIVAMPADITTEHASPDVRPNRLPRSVVRVVAAREPVSSRIAVTTTHVP